MTRLKTFEKALRRLEAILAEPEAEVVRDAAIQRFEFTALLRALQARWETL